MYFTFAVGLSPVTLERHRALTTDFTNLYLEMEKEGLFLPSPIYVIGRIAELLFFLTAGVYLMYSDSWTLYALGMLSFGLFMGRCGWLDHDGAHISLTGKPKWDRFLAFLAFGNAIFNDPLVCLPYSLRNDWHVETITVGFCRSW